MKSKTLVKSLNNNLPLLIKGLYKKYWGSKVFSIKNLNFEVRKGEFHGFIGANGAGKTTTIKSIIGAYARIQGEIKIFGNKHSSIYAKKNIGYIPEVANFPQETSAFKYLKDMAFLSGFSIKKSRKFANQKLIEVGMEKFKNRNPNNFSSGQKKKILLAQALIGDPSLIIMDEPASNLDPKARVDFFNKLKKLQQKGKSIFISSHILVELAQYVDTVTIIDHGKIIYSGKVEDAIENNKLKYIFIFKNLESTNLFVDFLEKYQFNFKKNKEEIIVNLKIEKDIFTLMEFIIKNKLEIKCIKEDFKTLDDIYNQYVNENISIERKIN